MEACFILAYMVYKTTSEIPCESPLEYEGKRYDGCISMDNGGIPWCYTDHSKKKWGNCKTDISSQLDKGSIFLTFHTRYLDQMICLHTL